MQTFSDKVKHTQNSPILCKYVQKNAYTLRYYCCAPASCCYARAENIRSFQKFDVKNQSVFLSIKEQKVASWLGSRP